MNVDENFRNLKKNWKRINKVVSSNKYSLINKLNNLHIKQHFHRTFLDFNVGTSLESKWVYYEI